jgi:hypothetical protein
MNIDYGVGIFVIFTIVMLMLSFLVAVKVQTYSIPWSVVSLVVAGIQLIRLIFFTPDEIVGSMRTSINMMLLIGIVSLTLGGIISIMQTKKRSNYSRSIEEIV